MLIQFSMDIPDEHVTAVREFLAAMLQQIPVPVEPPEPKHNLARDWETLMPNFMAFLQGLQPQEEPPDEPEGFSPLRCSHCNKDMADVPSELIRTDGTAPYCSKCYENRPPKDGYVKCWTCPQHLPLEEAMTWNSKNIYYCAPCLRKRSMIH